MQHWDLLEWTDFVKGVGDPQKLAAMRRHLASGCPACESVVRCLGQVVADARAELEPPERAVRGALAVFALAARRRRSGFRWVPMQVVFDSWQQPVLPGTRARSGADRHLVLTSRRFTLETRLDCGSRGRELTVVGQIVARTGSPMARVPTFLMKGEEILSRTMTGRLGEFHIACRRERRLRLCLCVSGRELVEVDLQPRRPGVWPRGPDRGIDL